MTPIKNNIQIFRESKGLTQEELADKLGIGRTYLSKIENHRHSPGPELMHKVCAFFSVELGEMFDINEEWSENITGNKKGEAIHIDV